MKKLSRITALLLALMMLVTSVPITALAEITLDTSTWQNWVSNVKDAFQQAQSAMESFSTTVDVPVTAARIPQEYQTQAEYSTADTTAITLMKGATALLTNADGAGQWQIAIGEDQWANIAGETGATITLNEGMMMGGAATIRCGSGTPVTVTLSTADVLKNSDETIKVTVTGERVKQSGRKFSASDLGINMFTDEESNNENVKKTYNIVINYVFENNEIVSDPYTANLAEGSSFSATVTFPTVQGYLPYVGETQLNSMELNYTSVSENVTINVVYKPTNVNYTVIHYQQNVDNDQYTIESTETKQGLTASQVPEVAKTFEGFYSLLYERPAIAADGSTVIEVYYDRYYYLMNFDMDGGYGTEPVYARYGAEIGTVTEPTKAGYTFKGWSETKAGTTAVTLLTTMPAESKTYYAIWQVDNTAKVSVVFWGENADDEDYSYLSNYTKEIYLKPGREFTYSESEMLVCDKEIHTHTDDCLTCGKTEHTHSAVGGSCYTLTCNEESHTHSTACYTGVGGAATSGGTGKPRNPSEGQVYIGTFNTYIYIKGTWYYYTGSTSSGSIAPTTCGKTESTHTHTDSCYTLTCTTEEHTHTNACYTCGKEAHNHGTDCYMQGAGLDSKLWKFVKSDIITVAADDSSVVNVYYDRVEYTINFYNNPGNTEYTNDRITAKWGADIHDRWPTENGSSTWSVEPNFSSQGGTFQAYIQSMPVGGDKFYGPRTSNSSESADYYVEIIPGESASNTVNEGNVTYKWHHKDTVAGSGYKVTKEDRYDIPGFTLNETYSTSIGSIYKNAKFYYTRNSYKLTFNDQYDDVKNETVKFEAPLSTYKDYVPEVPSAYEPGSVEFGGWYQNPQCTGEEYKLDEHTMPSHDVILYAKWVPVKHTVTFYLDKSAYEAGTKLESHPAITVPHGELAKPTPEEPTNGKYEFVGWFYMDNGVEKAFDFGTMQVRKDLNVYGKWSSNTLMAYTVQYVLAEKQDDGTIVVKKDDEGNPIKVADDLTGSGLAGTTKTFDAKGGTELYAAYQEGYFPTVQSQSLLLDIESNSLVITFEYVPMPAVPYTVKYVEKDTGESLADDKVVSDNRKAVVTETFKPISGYMPDAYQKRLVVTADGENILYFYYSKDETHAYYKITHYTQNTDGETWTEYASSQAVGDIGTRYTASPMTIQGFTYKETKYVVNGTEVTDVTAEGAKLTADGLEINLYYVRNEYPYQVRYLEQGSGNVLHDPKNGTGKYGQVISESAIDIDGYDKVEPASATLTIHIDEGEGAPNLNIITFYYTEQEVTINYVAVGPEGATNFGSVDPTTETVKVKSGTVQGSTPTAGDGFKFVGWYKDEACTPPVDASWVTDNKITPQKTDDKNVVATYYAKFEYDVSTLTITKNGMKDDDSAIFKVTVNEKEYTVVLNKENNYTVTLAGLKVGANYSVEEDGNWSNRYKLTESKNASGTIAAPTDPVTVSFTNTKTNDQWLHDESSEHNVFTGASNNN